MNARQLEIRIEELERKEAFHRLITEKTTDMVSKHDLEGVFTFVSPISTDLVGYAPEELVGQNVYSYFHPDDIESIRVSHTGILRTPVIDTIAYRFRHKHGHYVWLEARSKTIRNPATGEAEEILAATRDISRRKKVEEELVRRFEFEQLIAKIGAEFLGLSSAQLDQGIQRALASIGQLSGADRAYVFLYQDNGVLVDNTHEWCAQGVEPQIDRLKNIHISKELPWFSRCLHAGDVFSLAHLLELPPEASLERVHFESQDIQSLIVVPMILGDRLLGFIGFDAVIEKRSWSENDKGVLRLFGEIFSNALERRRAEDELRISDERWQFALEGAGDGVWDWNPVTNQVFFSKQWKAMLGFAEKEIGNTLDEWARRVHPDDMPSVMESLDRHFSGEAAIYQSEHRILCKDGSFKWILDRGKVIAWTRDGKPERMIGTHADISERKRSETEREKLIAELQTALKKVKTLSGLLPICSCCKKIRDDKGYWRQLESYISEHSGAEFSHGLCLECARKLYPDVINPAIILTNLLRIHTLTGRNSLGQNVCKFNCRFNNIADITDLDIENK